MADKTKDYELNYITTNRFYVEMQEKSYISASFQECSGIGFSNQADTFYEGGVNNQQRIMLGDTSFTEVTLKRGMCNDVAFLGWACRMLTELNPTSDKNVSAYRRNVNILLFNQAGETVQVWTLIGAVPVGWSAPSFSADSSDVAIEELTLAYEGLKVIVKTKPSGGSSAGATVHSNGRKDGFFSSN